MTESVRPPEPARPPGDLPGRTSLVLGVVVTFAQAAVYGWGSTRDLHYEASVIVALVILGCMILNIVGVGLALLGRARGGPRQASTTGLWINALAFGAMFTVIFVWLAVS